MSLFYRPRIFGTLCIVCQLLVWPSVSQATITVTLENPTGGGSASGSTVISGWAFSDTGAPITVSLHINDELFGVVPCCGPRQDVANTISGAPLNTSFSLLFNYALLEAGVHTIRIEVSVPGEESVSVEHPIRVVKPGGAEFIDQLNLSQAMAVIEDNEIFVSGARVQSNLGTSTVDLRLGYNLSSQSPALFAAPDSDPSGEQAAALSGGDTTIFDATSQAFEMPSPNLTGARLVKHFDGDAAFGDTFVTAPSPVFSGLGPIFNNNACDSCHPKNGRGRPPRPGQRMASMFLRVSVPGTDAVTGGPVPVPGMGTQLQHRAVFGVPPEADVSMTETERIETFADGESISLRSFNFSIENPAEPLPAQVLTSPRVALPVFGRGLLEAISAQTILGLADEFDVDGDGISGRPNMVWDVITGTTRLGRFGWKANNPSLFQQTFGAYQQDMGITNPILTAESASGQVQDDGLPDDPEINAETVDLATFYVQTLAVPARRNVDAPQVLRGEELFHTARCAACHTPTLNTASLAGVPEMSYQTIHAYTDMLLHDMGEGLADGRPDFLATGREWRTAPLWGIGLTQRIQGHTFLLHDGRARNLMEAIMWHGGEAAQSREAVRVMSNDDRAALLVFLESL